MTLATLPPNVAFLDAIASMCLREAAGDPIALADMLILLPTRRAARSLAEAFLRQSDGAPLLLPRITAFGALDEAPLVLAGALDLPQAVAPAERLAVFSRLILALNGANGAPTGLDRAWPLAVELASLVDEAHREDVDLATALPRAADTAFAEHWQRTLTFLEIVTRAWPAWLAENGLMDPAARQVALLRAQARAWADAPTPRRVIAAGSTGGIPAVADVLRAVARLPRGLVVVPGLDLAMDDAAWEALDETHPQAGLRRLLDRLGATRGDVTVMPVPHGVAPQRRVALLSAALLPASSLGAWQERTQADLDGVWKLEPADPQQEAVAVALVMREALERPETRVALITPDRDLAGRVAAELLRFGVIADDSAGERLADSPPAAFLRLIAAAAAEAMAPVPLLAVLKHPLCAAGLSPAACREAARAMELAALRGQRPAPGFDGLRETTADQGFVSRLARCFDPLVRAFAAAALPPADLLAALVETAEALAETDREPGSARLWSGEDGDKLAETLTALTQALADMPGQIPSVLPGLLDAALEGVVVRSRRALRGRAGTEHPRVSIWGLLEARLQTADVVVLGGLTEGVWPQATDPGPWLSRTMRKAIGLASPEERIGQAAHDFVQSACCAPMAVLCTTRRRDHAPAVPTRWRVRLDAFLAGRGQALTTHPATEWAAALDQPDGKPTPIAPPEPRPAVAHRPRKLTVSDVELWVRDPYGLYAKTILRLRKLDPLDDAPDHADYGEVVHDGLSRFVKAYPDAWPADGAMRLRQAMDDALAAFPARPALKAWWRPRLARIADWVAEQEQERRATPIAIAAEIDGRWDFGEAGHPFTLKARADRIERRATDGSIAIIDYKTGKVPDPRAVKSGWAPQLPLEAAMVDRGAFGERWKGDVLELQFWKLSGGEEPGKPVDPISRNSTIIDVVADYTNAMIERVRQYDSPDQPYLSRPNPAAAPRYSDYTHLSRAAEWAAADEAEEEG